MTTRTIGLLTTKESNLAFRAAFRKLAHARELTAQHMALNAIVTGKPLGNAFSPVTNSTKLSNGQYAWANAWSAIQAVARYPSASSLALIAAAGLSVADVKAAIATLTDAQLSAQYQSRTQGEA